MASRNLLIITHRRSGTHLTIDAVRNNFARFGQRDCLVLETLNPAHPEHMPLAQMAACVERGGHVIKTHFRADELDQLPDDHRQFVTKILDESVLVSVVRNGMDVMASLFEFRRRHDASARALSFSQFIRRPTFDPGKRQFNKMEYWADHVRGWLSSRWQSRMLLVRYEDWIDNYQSTLRSLGPHLGERRTWLTRDVRIDQQSRRDRMLRTWVEPRKGVVGDYVNYFTQDDTQLFWELCGDVMRQLGYAADHSGQGPMRSSTTSSRVSA